MAPLYRCDSEGIFKTPLGDYDPSEEKWATMPEFFGEILTKTYPKSGLIEAKTDREITYEHLFRTGQSIVRQMQGFGIGARTILHMIGENCFDWLAILIASYLADYIISATHPNSPWPECSRNIETTCSTVLIMTETCYEKYKNQINHTFLTHVLITRNSGNGEDYAIDLKCINQTQSRSPVYNKSELKDVCQLLLSSGTTGTPKAIKMSHQMVIYSCLSSVSEGCLVYNSSDRSLLAQPLAHVGGQNVSFLAVATKGPTLVVTDYPGSVGLLQMTQKYKLTHIIAVPPVLNFLAKYEHLEDYDLSSVKYILTGATTPNFESINTIIKRSGNLSIKPKNLYGASELFGVCFCTNDLVDSSVESVGVGFRGVSFKLVDPDDDSKVITTAEEPGELVIKQHYPYLLYFNDPQKCSESMTKDGFYKTGDFAKFDNNFNLFICSRLKDIVKYRGFSVSPAEIEDILMESPLVADCSVVGQPDEKDGEIPVAFVVQSEMGKKLSSDEVVQNLISYVGKSIAEHKKLRGVYFIDKIPRNGNGKILKREMRLLLPK